MSLAVPASEEELAALLRAAYEAGEPLLVEGNGTKRTMLRPVQAARTLSTRGLSGIRLYAPQELVISAEAGTPFAEIEAKVAEKGQQIIAEPPDLSFLLGSDGPQTLGGVVATNLSGPRRVTAGAMRDHVLGLRAVNGMGEIFHSGGRVLKNVTGLDLCKLLTGSHGTLGVISEVTLKVLPAAERWGTLLLPKLASEQAVAALAEGLGSPYGVSAAAWLPKEAAAHVPALAWLESSAALLRIENFADSVVYRLGKLRERLAAFGHAELLDDAASRAAWRAIRDALPLAARPEEAVWRVSVRPSAGPRVLRLASAAGARGFLDWGGGLIWLAGPATPELHAAITSAVKATGGHWLLMRAPDALRVSVDVIPPEPPTLARLTSAVKSVFDPKGILNPGRMFAGV
ncbi:MAG: FAD-binding protein [Acidobacteriia bacterium]|nr:FAD-binding protein [Methyloceanibacter sp.]MCL6490342.1 FAD-binding protein [Terriglobia bacterium]